jgi:O-antigen/teichoic acid export membrane protein
VPLKGRRFGAFKPRVLHDLAIAKLGANAFRLIGSNAAQTTLGLVATVITARALSVQEFGSLSLIVAYGAVVTQLFSFQSIYAVIQIGTGARERGTMAAFLGVVRVGVWIDIAGALLAASVAWIGVLLAAGWLSIDAAQVTAVSVSCLGIATNISGTPTAVLRMRDRYQSFLWQGAVAGGAKLAFCLIAFFLEGNLLVFVIAWTLAQVLGNVMLIGLGMNEISKIQSEAAIAPMGVLATFRTFPKLGTVLVQSNLLATMRMVRETDILVVGYLLDSTAAGVFRIARQVGTVVHKLVDPFFHAIYPDLATASERAGPAEVIGLVKKASLLIGGTSSLGLVLFALIGEPMIATLLGSDYRTAFIPASFMVLGAVIWSFGHPFSPALMVWGRYGTVLNVTTVYSVLYVALVWLLADRWGVAGAAAAYAVFQLLWVFTIGAKMLEYIRSTTPGPARR